MSTSDQDIEFLKQALSPLVEPLYDSLDAASEIATGHFVEHEMDHPEYHPGLAHLARAHARRLLKDKQSNGKIDPWVVTVPQPNVQICLARDLLRLRLLRPDGPEVPKPGPNQARIAYFSNRHVQLYGIAGSQLLGLWAPDAAGEIRIQIIRTVGEAKYGARVPVDIDFWLPRDVGDLSQLEFEPSDDNLDVELPFAEPDEGEEREADDGSA